MGLVAIAASANAQGPAAPAAPIPYSLPWQLRPAAVTTGIRSDSSLGFWEDTAGLSGTTLVSGLIGTRRLSSTVSLLGRVLYTKNNPPKKAAEQEASAVANPLVGATFLRTRPGGRRAGFFAAATLPIGTGGGDSPKPGQGAALSRGIAARSAMDNALFAVNYFTMIGGITVARVTPSFTVQAEATLLQLFRVRGPESQDEARTNFTAGAHLGRSFQPWISAGLELRYQRWLSDAAPARNDPSARETVTFAFGPRFHFKLGGSKWIRPGLSLSFPLDDPLSRQSYRMVQVDVPVTF